MMATIDPMTAPLAEILDWLAERDGWKRYGCHWYRDEWDDGRAMQVDHPITLDRLSAMLLETHDWFVASGKGAWTATAHPKYGGMVYHLPPRLGITEHEARARVVAAVLMREA